MSILIFDTNISVLSLLVNLFNIIVTAFCLGLGTDYGNIQTLNFTACEEIACTNISIVDNEIVEKNKSFTISLEKTTDLDKRISLSPDRKQVTILDDDGMLIPDCQWTSFCWCLAILKMSSLWWNIAFWSVDYAWKLVHPEII